MKRSRDELLSDTHANALQAEARISGRHYIPFRVPKHGLLEKLRSKIQGMIFLPMRISTLSTLSGKSGQQCSCDGVHFL